MEKYLFPVVVHDKNILSKILIWADTNMGDNPTRKISFSIYFVNITLLRA